MSLSGTILGLVNIAITVGLFVLVGVVIMWFCSWMSIAVPQNVVRAYMIVVALIALYMVIALLFGIPTFGFVGPRRAVM